MANIEQTSVQKDMPRGRAGDLANSRDVIEDNLKNHEPEQKKEVDVTVDTASDDTDYEYTAEGTTVSITSGTGATKSSIAQKLADRHNNSPLLRAKVAASASGDTVTLKSVDDGFDFSFSESDANLSNTKVQDAKEAADTAVGRAIDEDGRELDETNFTPKSVTFTHGGGAGSDIAIRIASGVYQVSGDDASGMVSSIDGHSELGDVLDASEPSGGEVKIETQVAGDFFEIVDSDDLQSLDSFTEGDTIKDILAGVSRSSYAEEMGDKYVYPGESGVVVLLEGEIYVEGGDNASRGDPVFVDMTGDDAGTFDTSRTAGETARAPSDVLEWAGPNELKVRTH